jgi:hypothetical protein
MSEIKVLKGAGFGVLPYNLAILERIFRDTACPANQHWFRCSGCAEARAKLTSLEVTS